MFLLHELFSNSPLHSGELIPLMYMLILFIFMRILVPQMGCKQHKTGISNNLRNRMPVGFENFLETSVNARKESKGPGDASACKELAIQA